MTVETVREEMRRKKEMNCTKCEWYAFVDGYTHQEVCFHSENVRMFGKRWIPPENVCNLFAKR